MRNRLAVRSNPPVSRHPARTPRLPRPEAIDGGRGHLSPSTIDRIWAGHVAVAQHEAQRIPIDVAAPGRMRPQRLELGPEQQRPTHPSVVQRLLAKAVAYEVKRASRPVPERQGKHPVKRL